MKLSNRQTHSDNVCGLPPDGLCAGKRYQVDEAGADAMRLVTAGLFETADKPVMLAQDS
ncbi:MAG: hypothetical protein GY758_11220 [Fuerstiella sp.]|nr:hypothetical protein [Fuerstiella sp.]MCP4508677.1 hypothetical protein [Fuerstiella sp.]